MKTTLRRTLAATAVGAMAAASLAVTATPATAAAADGGAQLVRTGFGYNSFPFGSRLVVDGLEVLAASTGTAQIGCTQFAGRESDESVLPSELEALLPQELKGIVDLGVLNARSRTFRSADGKVHGTQSTTDLANVLLGGDTDETLPGLELPRLEISGLRSTAVARHVKGKGYEAVPSFTFADISLEPPASGPFAADSPVGQLYDVIQQVQDGIAPVKDVIETIVDLTADAPIEIPGLGSIDLREARTSVTKNSAEAFATTLDITIDTDETVAPTSLSFGRARARVGGPLFGNTFKSRSVPFSLDLLGMRALATAGSTVMPCEGSQGRKVVRTYRDSAPVLNLPILNLLAVKGAKTVYQAEHHRSGRIVKGKVTRRPWSEARLQTVVDEFSLPMVNDLKVMDLVSTVDVSSRKLLRKRNGVRTYIRNASVEGVLSIAGEILPLPAPGKERTFSFDGGDGVLRHLVPTRRTRLGQTWSPLELELFAGQDVVTINLGEVLLYVSERA